MSDHPINSMVDVTLDKVRSIVDVNTIVGDPICVEDGITLIPVSKVSFGFTAGGTDFAGKQPDKNFGGGSGAGVSINAVAFILIKNGDVRILRVGGEDSIAGKALDLAPELFEKITSLFKKEKPAEPQAD